jgi:hypothetical protein
MPINVITKKASGTGSGYKPYKINSRKELLPQQVLQLSDWEERCFRK